MYVGSGSGPTCQHAQQTV